MCGAFQQEDNNKLDREAANRMKDAENIGVLEGQIDNNNSYGQFWKGNWANSQGGVHGDIIIDNYTLSHKVMNNTMSRRGNYSNINRPIARFDMYGYMHQGNMADGSTPSGYCRQTGQIRQNIGRSPSQYGGFRLYPSTGNWAPDPEINIYGMRSPAY